MSDFIAEGVPAGAVVPLSIGAAIPPEEHSRRVLAYWLMAILTFVCIFIGLFIYDKGADSAAAVVSVFLTPIIGLVGTVLGFYFGGTTDTE